MNLEIDYLYYGKSIGSYNIPIKTAINDNIKIYYALFLEDGTRIETPYNEFPFYFEELGYSNDFEEPDEENNGTVIKGLDKIITELSLGDFVRVKVPYQYGYGENGIPYLIPKSANLIYYLQLVYIERNNNIFEYTNIINIKQLVKEDNIDKIKSKI